MWHVARFTGADCRLASHLLPSTVEVGWAENLRGGGWQLVAHEKRLKNINETCQHFQFQAYQIKMSCERPSSRVGIEFAESAFITGGALADSTWAGYAGSTC